MKKLFMVCVTALFIIGMMNLAEAELICNVIQDGTITTEIDNVTITTGYDDFGYNYGAHIFNGVYSDLDRVPGGIGTDVDLIAKWNDGWLSNQDCDGDGKLDRHLGLPNYIGSGAWLTNHQAGKVLVGSKLRKWTYFIKIVAVDEDATKSNGYWYSAEGIEIGPVIWNDFAVIQEVYNDPSLGAHGILYNSPAGPGLGQY